jgi:hypothetical protein
MSLIERRHGRHRLGQFDLPVGRKKRGAAMAAIERATRTTWEVFEDHLTTAATGDVEADIARNYAPDVVLLTGIGVLHGHDGVRRSRSVLRDDVGDATYEYVTKLVDREAAFLEWRAQTDAIEIDDGADSFVIRDGLIRIQTIHYSVRHRTGYHERIVHELDDRRA